VPQRGKKGYASLKATRRVAFLKRRFARLDPLTSVTQPAPQALVNIVTNHRLQLTLLDPQVAQRGKSDPIGKRFMQETRGKACLSRGSARDIGRSRSGAVIEF